MRLALLERGARLRVEAENRLVPERGNCGEHLVGCVDDVYGSAVTRELKAVDLVRTEFAVEPRGPRDIGVSVMGPISSPRRMPFSRLGVVRHPGRA